MLVREESLLYAPLSRVGFQPLAYVVLQGGLTPSLLALEGLAWLYSSTFSFKVMLSCVCNSDFTVLGLLEGCAEFLDLGEGCVVTFLGRRGNHRL